MMECRALFFVVFLSLCINQVTSLTCYECNSATDADRDACFAGNATEMTCTSYQDTCVIILTKILLPNNGPQDRKSDNEELSQITRTCGNKAGFDHLAKIDKRCTVEAIGGGGTQTRCLCSGNLCNSATTMKATLALFITALLVKFM